MVIKDGIVTFFKLGSSSCLNVLHEDHDFQTWPIFLPKKCIYTAREVWPATGEFVVISHVL